MSSLSLAFGPKMVSISSNRIVTPSSLLRNRYAGETFTVAIGFGTRSSVTSRARVLPLAGSADKNASLGVDSHDSIMCVWTIHSAWARWACSLG